MTTTSQSEWYQQYLYNPTTTNAISEPQFSDPAVVSTVTASAPPLNNSNIGLRQEGRRVSKPTRKRSRASRKNPTTLLNTDTSNFRAMVQMYTGGNATTVGFNVHQGQIRNFSQPSGGSGSSGLLGLHYPSSSQANSSAAFDLHQRLLLQNVGVEPCPGPTNFSLTANINARSATSTAADSADQTGLCGPTNWIGF